MITVKKTRKTTSNHSIRDYILSNYAPGDQLPGESELIRNLGASRYAILKSMTEMSAEGILERRQGQGTFMTRPALGGQSKRSRIVAFVADEFESNMTVELARGIEEYLRSRQYNMLLLNSGYDTNIECRNLDEVMEQNYAGVIALLGDHPLAVERARALTLKGIPLVQIDRHYPGIEAPWVETDHEEGAYQVVKHLIELGHRKIGHITFHDNLSSGKQRFAGYCRALAEAGIELCEDYVQYARTFAVSPNIHDDAMELAAYEPAHKLISMTDRPTAIFLMNDCFAPGALRAIMNHGLKIPDDISIAGFDDGPIAKYLQVPLTTLAQPFREIGRKAAGLIEQAVDGDRHEPRQILMHGKLVVRSSTGRIPVEKIETYQRSK